MFETYKIGVSLEAVNRISPVLNRVIADLKRVDATAKQVQKTLSNLGASPMIGLNSTLAKINSQLRMADKNARDLRNSLGGVRMQNVAVDHGIRAAQRLAQFQYRIERDQRRDAERREQNARRDAERRQRQGSHDAGIAGYMAYSGGKSMLGSLASPIDTAREYALELTKFKTLNLGDAVNAEADKFARGANVMGVSAKELLETMHESVGIFGDFQTARNMSPLIAQLNKANSAIFGGKINAIDEASTRALMKFIDRRGGSSSPESFKQNLELAQRMVTGSGGFIQFKDLANFSQYGGTAFRSLSDEGLINLAGIMQEQGGARAGTSLMSIYQNLVAGRTPKKTMAMLQEFGLGTLAMQEHATVGGKSMKSMILTDIKEAGLLQSNPVEWFRSVMLPTAAQHGVTDEAGILKLTNDLLSNRTSSSQASLMTTQVMQLIRDAKLTKGAMGAQQTIGAFKNDPNAKFADFQAKWTNFKLALGRDGGLLDLATRGLNFLGKALQKVTSFAKQHPIITRFGLTLGAMLAVITTLGGAVVVAGAALATFRLGIAGLGGAASAAGGAFGSAAAGLARLSTAAAALGAAYIGYKAGQALNDHVINPAIRGATGDKNATLGTKIYDWTHGKSAPHDMRPPGFQRQSGSDFVRPGAQKVNHTTQINLDGKKIAENTVSYMTRSASRRNSPGGFDGRLSMPQPAFV